MQSVLTTCLVPAVVLGRPGSGQVSPRLPGILGIWEKLLRCCILRRHPPEKGSAFTTFGLMMRPLTIHPGPGENDTMSCDQPWASLCNGPMGLGLRRKAACLGWGSQDWDCPVGGGEDAGLCVTTNCISTHLTQRRQEKGSR